MEPLGLGQTRGPDAESPEAWFESSDYWYGIDVLPLRLSHRLALQFTTRSEPIMNALYEELLGGLAARVDHRHKLLVWRKQPPLFQRGWFVVQVEVHPDRESAEVRRTAMLADWDPRVFSDAPALGTSEVRETLGNARRAVRRS